MHKGLVCFVCLCLLSVLTHFLFFQELCEPNCYVKMLDDRHKEELRHFKHRSKSWTGGDAATSKRRGNSLRPRRSTVDSHTNTLKS